MQFLGRQKEASYVVHPKKLKHVVPMKWVWWVMVGWVGSTIQIVFTYESNSKK